MTIKIPLMFAEIEKKILKFTQKHKRPPNSPNRDQAERENKAGVAQY